MLRLGASRDHPVRANGSRYGHLGASQCEKKEAEVEKSERKKKMEDDLEDNKDNRRRDEVDVEKMRRDETPGQELYLVSGMMIMKRCC